MAVDDSYTKILLHMDGADAGTVFTDESGKTWTAAVNAQTSTTQSKLGGASGYFDGSSYITTPHSSDVVFSGDFSFDWWAYLSSVAGARFIYFGGAASDIMLGYNGAALAIGRSGVAFDTQYNHGISTNTWAHFAICRNGSNIYMFANGTSIGSTTNSVSYVSTGTQAVGGRPGVDYFSGYIDELRVSVGIARWTSNFTPPTQPYGPRGHQVVWFA